MDLVQRRKQLRLRQVEKVKKFRDSNQSSSDAIEKQNDREQMKKEIKKELSQESINIENSDGTTFAKVMDIIGPTHMKPVVSGGLWKGTEQISEKKSECKCDCGQDPCIECGESHHNVKEELVSERLGGKGYKSYTSLTGKKVSGDWEDSDRGAGNKAKKRAGGKVEKKSPTYQAYVLNKEAKEEQGRSDYGKASVRNKRRFGTSGESPDPMTGKKITKDATRGELIDKRREEHKAKRGVKEDYYSGTGEKVVARTKKWMDKKGQKGAPGLDAMKARAAEHKARRNKKDVKEALGAAYAIGGVSNAIAAGAKAWGASQAAKGAIIGGALSGAGSVVGGALNYAASRNKNKKSDPKKKKSGVKEQMEKDTGVDDQQQKQIDSKQKKADQIKKQVLLKKLQAVRQGGGSEIMASYSWRDDKNMRINKILNS